MEDPASGPENLHAAIVRDISHALGESATLAEAAPRMLAAVCEPLGWHYGALWEVDRAGKRLRWVGEYHIPSKPFDRFAEVSYATQFAPGIGLPGRVWASRRPAWIADVTQDDNFPRAKAAAKSGSMARSRCRSCVAPTCSASWFFSRDIRQPDAACSRRWAPWGARSGCTGSQAGGRRTGTFFNLSQDMLCTSPAWTGLPSTQSLVAARARLRGRGAARSPFLDFVHPDDRAGTIEAMSALTSGAR